MSFDIFDTFATDENLENNGAIFPLGKDSSLLIARAGNRKYSRAITKSVENRKVELDMAGADASDADNDAAAAVSDEIMVDVMARTILLGWTNLTFKKVEMGEYTVEKAKKLLAIKDFRKYVATFSDQMEAYKLKEEAEAGKG